MSPRFVRGLLASSSLIPFVVSEAQAQTTLPEIVVESQRSAPPRQRPTTPTTVTAPSQQPDSNATLAAQNTQFDIARDGLSPRFGASTFDMNRPFIETLPAGTNTPLN